MIHAWDSSTASFTCSVSDSSGLYSVTDTGLHVLFSYMKDRVHSSRHIHCPPIEDCLACVAMNTVGFLVKFISSHPVANCYRPHRGTW